MTDLHMNDFCHLGALAHRASARVREEVRFRRALNELRLLDDRELHDLNLDRGDLPGLARRHARGDTGLARFA